MLYALDGIEPTTEGEFWIAPNAIVVGAVTLARDASVWWGAVLRGDNEPITIGPGSNIQDNCVLHTDIGLPLEIGADVTVGHGAILHGCTVGDGTLIGMGACVLNGARIGRDCLIGAKALVPEGRVIADRSIVLGVPARLTGEVTPEQVHSSLAGARHYVANARRFRAGLKEVRALP